MVADNPATWTVKNGQGVTASATNTVDANGNITPQFAIRTNGAAVEEANPLPTMEENSAAALVAQQAAVTALGTPADAPAASDSANGSMISLLKRVIGKLPPLGQATKAASLPVTLASDQGSLAVSGTVGISGTTTVTSAQLPASLGQTTKVASLPTIEAADSPMVMALGTPADAPAANDSANGSMISLLKRVIGKLPPLGQATKAASLPVTLASDQGSLAVSGTVGISGTTAVTSAQLPASLGQATKVASLPVTLASDQGSLAVTGTVGISGTTAVTSAQLPASLGQKTMAASAAVTIASDQTSLTTTPAMTSSGHISVATNTTNGATFTPFAAQACKQVTVVNDTGVPVELQQGGAGVALPVFAADKLTFFGLSNANQLAVRRVDQATTTVTLKARWES